MMEFSLMCHVSEILHAQATRSLSWGRAVHRTLKPETPVEPLTEAFTGVFPGFTVFPDFAGVPRSPGITIHAERSSNGSSRPASRKSSTCVRSSEPPRLSFGIGAEQRERFESPGAWRWTSQLSFLSHFLRSVYRSLTFDSEVQYRWCWDRCRLH